MLLGQRYGRPCLQPRKGDENVRAHPQPRPGRGDVGRMSGSSSRVVMGAGGMHERSMSLRNAAVAVTLAATVGIWAVAMWAWIGPGPSTAPTAAPTAVGTRMPAVNGLSDQ